MIFHYQLYACRPVSMVVRCPGEIKFDSLSFPAAAAARHNFHRGVTSRIAMIPANFGMESRSRDIAPRDDQNESDRFR